MLIQDVGETLQEIFVCSQDGVLLKLEPRNNMGFERRLTQ